MSGDQRTGIGVLSDPRLKRYEEKARHEALFAKIGVNLTYKDILDLLQDEVRLKEVVSKLKMKVFW